jgi:hypothetical protein
MAQRQTEHVIWRYSNLVVDRLAYTRLVQNVSDIVQAKRRVPGEH